MVGPLGRGILRELRARKWPLLTLVLIATVGVGNFVGMASVWLDLDGARASYYREYHLADFLIRAKRVPETALARLETRHGIARLEGRVRTSALVELPGGLEPVPGTCLSIPESPAHGLNGLRAVSGDSRRAPGDGEVLLNDSFAAANGLRAGDRIRALLPDRQHDLLIVGTVISPEFVYLLPESGGIAPDPERFGVLYFNQRYLQDACDIGGAVNELIGTVTGPTTARIERAVAGLTQELEPWGVSDGIHMADSTPVRFLADELRGLGISAAVMPSIFLAVAALVLNVVLGRLVVQQRTVIGTLMAIGYSRRRIVLHYLTYGLVIGAAASTAGLLLGAWLQRTMLDLYRQFYTIPSMEAHAHPGVMTAGVALCMVFSLAGTWRGVRAAAALTPAEAMRPAPPESGRRVLLERVTILWARLPLRAKLVVRTISRNPFRSAVAIGTSAMSTSLVFTTLSLYSALDFLTEHEFARVSREDISFTLRDPVGAWELKPLSESPAVTYAELQLAVPVELSKGFESKKTSVTGLPPGPALHVPRGAAGTPVNVPTAGLLLTAKLAEILGAGVGDVVQLRPLIGPRRTVEVPVAAISESYFGLGCYADRRYLSGLISESDAGNRLLTRTFEGEVQVREFLASARQMRPVIGYDYRRRALEQIERTFGDNMSLMLGILIVFSGLLAFGSIVNNAIVSLGERIRDVSTFRVLGYTPRAASALFSSESVALGLLGIAAGLFGGTGLTHFVSVAYSTELYRFPATIHPSHYLFASLIMAGFIALAQLAVFRTVARMDWLDALKTKE